MTEIDPAFSAVLDAEYRELVRSLHRETIDIIIAVESWWIPDNFRVAVSAGGGFELNERDQKVAANAEASWRDLHRKLAVLINGHPDPDVRQAADILSKRTFAAVMIMTGPLREGRDEENSLATQLINDGIIDLRRAAYHAPFRVHRPEPEWDGVPTGNKEGMTGDILNRMKERGEHYEG